MLVYKKHLLFDMHGINVKVLDEIRGSKYQSTSMLEAHSVSETSSSIQNPRGRTHSRNSVNPNCIIQLSNLSKMDRKYVISICSNAILSIWNDICFPQFYIQGVS